MGFACQTSAFGLLPRAREVYFMNMQKTKCGKRKNHGSKKAFGSLGFALESKPLVVWSSYSPLSGFLPDELTFCQCYELIVPSLVEV